MIIRAVSDSDSDGNDDVHDALRAYPESRVDGASSVFPMSPSNPVAASKTTVAVRLVWLGTTLTIVGLLLVDLAATMNYFFPAEAREGVTIDPFSGVGVLSWLGSSPEASSSVSATVWNNVWSMAFVSAWIYNREDNLKTQRRKSAASGRSAVPVWLLQTLPWCVIVAVVVVGHVATALYVLLALFESHGSQTKFWVGSTSRNGARTLPQV
ncbi:hypothetical protein Poli38472_007496 [Pythium oligandrum]|uniref:Uncharacterized protein n=1 Tax=Pythium oligandrum TaxID=41045 RepID=A0A8K1CQM0_PYTOL|nr:hypothetical protein Poli38472_007496 [Pythium oligandrum]|eukprot:TMW67824.1 hypothetical protein Poli38472_007496 [Pythium oligandrum]